MSSSTVTKPTEDAHQSPQIDHRILTSNDLTSGLKKGVKYMFWFTVLAIVWVVSGIAAFVTSLVCIGRSGGGLSKAGGVIISMIFGPLYFIYLLIMKKSSGYCSKP